ncbi:LemA family protein [archaeon]|nr:LemA family protein [archaeon]
MKWVGIGIIVLIILILVAVVWGSYNSLVALNQNADNAWANVETQYQRRIDLIPNLVNTVKGYAGFEQSTLTKITEIRSQWQTQTPEQQVKSANEFESALSKLLLVAENYPDLKASQNYIALQDALAETENMISVARTRYNDAIRNYNTATKVFPSNVIAGWFGFFERTYFSSQKGAENAPVVNVTI